MINYNESALKLIVQAIKMSGFKNGKDISICLDVAANELIKKGKYSIHSKKYISVKKSINEDIPFSDIEITYSDSKPQIVIFGNHKNKYKFLASLTHDAGVAVGVVISKKLS